MAARGLGVEGQGAVARRVRVSGPGLILFTYLHLAPLPELTTRLLEARVSAVADETIRERDGSLPLLTPMSEVAGRLAVQIGARYLEAPSGGRGVLLGGGVAGHNAAKVAFGMGAHVTILDKNLGRLRGLDDIFHSQVVTHPPGPGLSGRRGAALLRF